MASIEEEEGKRSFYERSVRETQSIHMMDNMTKSTCNAQRKTVIFGHEQRLGRRKTLSTKTLISLAIISYIISNQIFMTALISSIKLLNANSCAADQIGLNSSLSGRSLIQLASANPVPAPLKAASARSATSQRVPPINGSMFGKRDLASNLARGGSQPPGAPSSKAMRYNEIITDAIENFMAKNTEGDPEATTEAFCRMIVYECNQLANRRKRPRSSRPGRSD